VKRTAVIHPFLFAIWPIVFTYSQNVEYISFSQTWLSLLIVLGLAILLFLLLAAVLRNLMKAGAVVSCFLILFFSYAHVYSVLWKDAPAYSPTPESLALLIAWALLFAGGTALVMIVHEGWREITTILNAMALVLIAISVLNIGVHEFRARISRQNTGGDALQLAQVRSVGVDSLPNIYYIILDSYARADILNEVYKYDNSEFSDFLKQKGFFVADKSLANYAQTDLSLASSLNLSYLDELAAAMGPDTPDRRPLEDMIQNSSVVRFLKRQGYTIVALASGYSATDLRNSDVHISPARSWNEFEIRLLCSTPIPWLAIRESVFDPYAVHRQKILYTLDHITDASRLPAPYFVFAHVLAPHGPYVFDGHGNAVQPQGQFDLRDGILYDQRGSIGDEDLKGYTEQLTFINNKVESVLDHLLSESSRPTIVILQGDHGPGPLLSWDDPNNSYVNQKLAILNAYLLPGEGAEDLYEEITPVNTFRLIFNRYLGTDLEQLEDRSYFSSWNRPYELWDVTDVGIRNTHGRTDDGVARAKDLIEVRSHFWLNAQRRLTWLLTH
jgi:hypothetical protein